MGKIISTVFACVLVSLCACSSVPVQKGVNKVVIKNVPFFPQEDYQCGPSSLAGVLHYWGSDIAVEDIKGEIFSRSARGTLTMDMLLYAQNKGFAASQYTGSLNDLKSKVKLGHPLIVLVDYGFFVYRADHFMVVIGFDDDGIIVNSGKSEKLHVPNKDFVKIWQRTNNWTLWIKPKDNIQH